MSALELSMLGTLFDASAPLSVSALEQSLGCTRRALWAAIRNQHVLGNVKKGDPIALTASARIAIAAGRAATIDWRAAA